jgi:hypothetical protein
MSADQFRKDMLNELFKKITRNKFWMTILCQRLNLYKNADEELEFAGMEIAQAASWFLHRLQDNEIDVGQIIAASTQEIDILAIKI